MTKLQVPFFRPALQEQEVDAVVGALRSGWLTSGPRVSAFEKEFAAAIGAKGEEQGAKGRERKSEVGDRRSEIRDQRSEIRGRSRGVGWQTSEVSRDGDRWHHASPRRRDDDGS